MKFLIVEDEKPNANRLKKIVEQLDSSFQVVDIIDSVAGAVDWFNKNPHPDIVLMDIRLADGLSFDI
ncbi:MAG TPA: response regulator, partial [Bacteroidia bacterium]|nr:response regulator [Bacteroidia bacterium]